MLKNKIIIKKIRNIFILLMAIIIMLSAYHNIRNSKAENVIQIELEVADKNETLSVQTITVDATETSDGNYLLNLPISVNKNIVTKYYTSSGEEIVVDAENNVATIQLTEEEVADKKVQVQTEYDTKEVTINDETILLYKKELTNETEDAVNSEMQDEKTVQDEEKSQDVIVTGYMPEDAKLEVKEIDLASLTSVKVPDEKQTMQKAYEISIYKTVEKTNAETENQSTDEEQPINSEETNEKTTQEIAQTEKAEYNLSIYGENIKVKTKYNQTNVIPSIYGLDDNNQLTEVEYQISEDKTTKNDENIETISFDAEKTDKTIKYILVTEEKKEESISQENTTDGDTNHSENNTINNDVSNSGWKVIDSNMEIVDGTATVKIEGPEDILTDEYIKVFVNGTVYEDGITKTISEKNVTNNGVQYTITVTGIPTNANQVKIGLVKPQSVRKQENQAAQIQTLALEDDEQSTGDTVSTIEDTESDDSEIILLETTYNTLRSTAKETDSDSGFLGNPYVERKDINTINFTNDTSELPIRNYWAEDNNWKGNDKSLTTWKDLAGMQDRNITWWNLGFKPFGIRWCR